MPYPGLLHPEPLQQATADPHLHRRHSDTVLAQSCGLSVRFGPFPGLSSSGDQVLGDGTVPGGLWSYSPPRSRPLGFLGALRECHLRCAVCLLWGADLRLQPSWPMSTIQDPRKMWLADGGLLTVWWRMLSLGPRLPLAFWLWLSPACLSASGQAGASPQLARSPLGFAQSFVF